MLHGVAGIAARFGPVGILEGLGQQDLDVGEGRISGFRLVELQDRDALAGQRLLIGAEPEKALGVGAAGQGRRDQEQHRDAAHHAPPLSPIQARTWVARWRSPVGAVMSSAIARKRVLAVLKSPCSMAT